MKFIKSLWILGAVLYSLFFLLSCFSWAIAPSTFQYISFPALTFPFLFAGQVVLTLITFFIRKRTAFFCLVCLCFSFWNVKNSFAFNSTAFNQTKSTSAFRILTWNVKYFLDHSKDSASKRLEILKVLKEYNADIICLQDYQGYNTDDNANVQNELTSLGYKYQLISDTADTYSGVAIMSKFKIISGEILDADTATGEKMLSADIIAGKDTVRVYSTHLQSYSLFADTSGTHTRLGNYKIGYQRKRYFVKRIRDVEKIHERQVELIRTYFNASPHPIIFCGDINSVPTSYTYSALSKGLKDVHLEKGKALGGTYFHLFPTLRIDVCLTDKRFRIEQSTVDQRKLSDHKAVIADISFNR